MYLTSDMINGTYNALGRPHQHRFALLQIAGELTERALRCEDIFDDNELMGILVEKFTHKIRQNFENSWSTN